LLTTFKKQLTFTTLLYNYTNAEQFKAVGLKNLLAGAVIFVIHFTQDNFPLSNKVRHKTG
jgi:hypothetical protein